jgi:radical SAM superfamily enzyme YgiQ (UPF0313 family)
MKVIFLEPTFKVQTRFFFNLGNLSLASLLRESGHHADIISTNHLLAAGSIPPPASPEDFYSQIIDHILAADPDMVDFYCLAGSYHTTLELSRRLKAMRPRIGIVFGGPQAALTAEPTLRAFPWVDVIGTGEGEPAILDLLRAFTGELDLAAVPNIAYREGDVIHHSQRREWIEDLDTLPFPDYTLIPDLQAYTEIPVETGRGCPFNCTFCASQTYWAKKIRHKSNERILKEIRTLFELTGCAVFSIIHDLFTLQRSRLLEFCRMMAAADLPVTWKCCSRADTLDEEMIRSMAAGGCTGVLLGVETGSPRMQRRINKNLDLSKVLPVIDLLKRYGMEVKLSFLYGFPGETRRDLEETLDLIRQAVGREVDYVSLQECVIFSGTPLHREHRWNLALKEGSTYFISDPFPQEMDLVRRHPDIFPHYYRPHDPLLAAVTHLDNFVGSFYMVPYPYLRRTIDRMVDHYQGSLLAFFQDFIGSCPEFPEVVYLSRSTPYPEKKPFEFICAIIGMYEEFMLRSRLEESCPGITALFTHEKDTFRFMYG